MSENSTELHWLSGSELARRIRGGETSSLESTRLMLRRIAALDARLHSFCEVLEARALEQAATRDAELRAGTVRGPLHGVPVAAKDLLSVAGIPRGAGTRVQRALGPQNTNAAVISRLLDAGVVLLGTLSLTEGALASYHPDVVPPVNPWNADRWSGVSSSGSGVAVAAGLCYAALGTDTGGSIRFPSAVNGVVGLKPSFGLVPDGGCFPLCPSMDHIGPMARSVEDAGNMLSAMAANAGFAEEVSQPASLAGVRIGVDEGFVYEGTDPAIVTPIMDALALLERAGARITPIRMPAWEEVEQLWMLLCLAETREVHAPWYPSRRADYGEEFAQLLDHAAGIDPALLQHANEARERFRTGIAERFGDIDLVACPSLGIAVPSSRRLEDENIPTLLRFTAPFNASGNPTLSLPCGFASDGMPLSLQLVADHGQERRLLAAGCHFQAMTDWHQRHPTDL